MCDVSSVLIVHMHLCCTALPALIAYMQLASSEINVSSLSGKAQLQEELRALGADHQGTKVMLIDRLHALLANAGVRSPHHSPSPIASCAHTPACHLAARPMGDLRKVRGSSADVVAKSLLRAS